MNQPLKLLWTKLITIIVNIYIMPTIYYINLSAFHVVIQLMFSITLTLWGTVFSFIFRRRTWGSERLYKLSQSYTARFEPSWLDQACSFTTVYSYDKFDRRNILTIGIEPWQWGWEQELRVENTPKIYLGVELIGVGGQFDGDESWKRFWLSKMGYGN